MIFEFDDPLSDVRSKEVKRLCLVELIEYIGKSGVMNTEELYAEFMHMVCNWCIYQVSLSLSLSMKCHYLKLLFSYISAHDMMHSIPLCAVIN